MRWVVGERAAVGDEAKQEKRLIGNGNGNGNGSLRARDARDTRSVHSDRRCYVCSELKESIYLCTRARDDLSESSLLLTRIPTLATADTRWHGSCSQNPGCLRLLALGVSGHEHEHEHQREGRVYRSVELVRLYRCVGGCIRRQF